MKDGAERVDEMLQKVWARFKMQLSLSLHGTHFTQWATRMPQYCDILLRQYCSIRFWISPKPTSKSLLVEGFVTKS